MPKIDTDLFQVLTLALLFLSLLALLATLSVLSGIKRRTEEGSGGLTQAPSASSLDYQAPADSYGSAPASYEPSSAYSTAPQTQTQEVNTGFVSVADVTPATQTEAVSSLTGGLRGDEPEEQPFERDGRWWFKRGGELLVYDEGTGQWIAAPDAAGTSTAVTPAPAYSSEATGVQTSVSPRVDAGEGWKCSSCGAVNGSTATTCRMCFAPR